MSLLLHGVSVLLVLCWRANLYKKAVFAKIVAALNEMDFRSRRTTPRGGR
ncbi:hypothetical protein ACQCVP_03580 [Rossellomorea vietnamensis]